MVEERALVSIMMPAYNAEPYIAQAIESVLAQTYNDWELIVVDDGSRDDTLAIASGYADPRITVVHQANAGEASARNVALQHARGRWLAFLDADDLYLPAHLELTVHYLVEHPTTDAVYVDGRYCTAEGGLLQTLSSRRRGPFEGYIFPEVIRASDVFGPPLCVVMRLAPVVQHGLQFDERIVIGPDWDFLVSYAEVARFGYLDQITCLYRIHGSNISLQTGSRGRALHMALCREKATQMAGFRTCPLDVRLDVFYDLLVNLLRRHPVCQDANTRGASFAELPAVEQARLLRLMAGKALAAGDLTLVGDWLKRALALDPAEKRGRVIYGLYRLSPRACRLLMWARNLRQPNPIDRPAFTDLDLTERAGRHTTRSASSNTEGPAVQAR